MRLEGWERFGRDGHEMVRTGDDEWTCRGCGATADTRSFTGLPDDSWMRLRLPDGRTVSETGAPGFTSCREARELVVEAVMAC